MGYGRWSYLVFQYNTTIPLPYMVSGHINSVAYLQTYFRGFIIMK